MSSEKERRRALRYPVRFTARFRVADSDIWESGRMLTIGYGGAFLQTDLAFQPGQSILLELPFQSGAECFDATIRWRSSSSPVGIGIQFNDADGDYLVERVMEEIISGRWIQGDVDASASNNDTPDIFTGDIPDVLE